MKREQRTIQVWKALWTYKESPEGSDGGPRKSDMSKTEINGHHREEGREQQVR